MNVEEEAERLKEETQRLGKVQPGGSYEVNLRVKQLQTSQYFCLSSYSSVLEFLHMMSGNAMIRS